MDVTVAVPLYPGSTFRFGSTDGRLLVAARAVVAVAVRAAVVRPVDVAVRATVAPVAADVARVAPPVVLAAAARVAAVDVAVRVDVVVVPARGDVAVVPRDATVRDAVARGDAVVVRAATTRDEFPFADPRPDAVVAPADVGIARVVVVRFATGVAFTGAREIFTGVCIFCVSASVSVSTISSGATKKPFSSYMPSAYSIASFSSMKTGATSANAGITSSPPINIASRFMVKISFLYGKFIIL